MSLRPLSSRPRSWLSNWTALALFVAFTAALIHLGRSDEGAGLRGRYFDNMQCEGEPVFERVDPVLNFSPPRDPEFDWPELCVHWSGTLFVPVAGHYSFAVLAVDEVTVWLDEKVIVESPMEQARAVSFLMPVEAGKHALRIHYRYENPDGDFSLLWDRPGRRWYAEYIPEWLLAPDPVDVARQPGRPNDRLRLVAFWLAFASMLLFVTRASTAAWVQGLRERPESRALTGACLGVALLSVSLSALGTTRPGQAWDESAYITAGFNLMRAFLDADFRVETWWWNSEHPGLVKWLYGTAEIFGADIQGHRSISLLCGALTSALVVIVSRDLFGRLSIGIAAGALFAMHPHVVAYHSTAGLEAPSALFFTASMALGLRALREDATLTTWLSFGAAVGCATATKLTNAKAGIAIILLFLWAERRTIWDEGRLVLPLRVLAAPALALAVFVAATPRLWSNPSTAMARLFGKWGDVYMLQPFLGEFREGPAGYLAVYLAAVTPAAILVGAAIFLLALMIQRRREQAVLALWIALPLSSVGYPVLVDGARYAFVALAPLCIAAAAGTASLVDRFAGEGQRLRVYAAVITLAALSVASQLRSVGFHYGYDYYNEWVGGAGHAQEEDLFLTGWWGEGIGEACDFLNANALPGSTVGLDVMPQILVELRTDLRPTAEIGDYLLHNGIGFKDPYDEDDYELIHSVEAQGARIASVYKRKD